MVPSCVAVAAPPWFAVGLANALAPIQASLDQIHAKLANAHASRLMDILTPLPNSAGAISVQFVLTKRCFTSSWDCISCHSCYPGQQSVVLC
jgi:hypothetical protein